MQSETILKVFFLVGLLPLYFFGPIFFLRLVTGVTFLDPIYNFFSNEVFGFAPMISIVVMVLGGLVYGIAVKKERNK